MTLSDTDVVILGGSSGIGLAVAQATAGEGARVTIASSSQTRLDAALAMLPVWSQGRVLDVSKASAVEAFFEETGAIDHLVYTAAENLRLMPLDGMDIAAARSFFELRYWGALTAAKAARRHLRTTGSIVLTSGTAGARPGSGWGIAASICGAMEGLTRALAVELAPLRVNVVAPGVVRTPLWDGMDAASRDAFYAAESKRLPVGHVGEAEEIAQAYTYLMRQTYVSGQVLHVDGGGLLA
ncbi:SDR family oxidoreductase [Methylobacterium sp. C25]|uniref:SDR family oxidoreductase n=1 Tax=Methylobacterium sp. C25 TaxID=2721622 RepID=UPI001F3EC408|nr:SDR family oxidoreductase [Methylobacterium sp. C25]MCE4223156.1 SDR family oxidoreductase [Methylobacterium sp. C25]